MDLQNIINQESKTLVDIREPFEMMLGKAKGAINIPLRRIQNRVDEFRQMSKPIIVYCRSGNRSGQALKFLKEQGIQEVYDGGRWESFRSKSLIKK